VPETEADRDDRASRFRALYTTHYQAMLAYAIRRTEPSEDATDIVAESLPSATFAYAAMFLNAGSPPALRAALYQVIESLPGVRDLGPVRDRLGRLGQGVGLVTGGSRSELIFDPGSTSVLEDEMVAVRPPQDGNNYRPAGTVLQYTLYVQQGVVNSARATPPRAAG